MTKPTSRALFALLTLLLFAAPAVAQDSKPADSKPAGPKPAAELPAAEKLLDKYIEATGGKAAHQAIQARQITAKMVIPAQGLEMTIELSQKQPNLIHTKVDLGNLGAENSGYTNGIAWTASNLQGNRLLEGEELANMKLQAAMDAEWNWRKHYAKVETIGETEIDGQPCFEIRMTPKEGTTSSWFVNKESGLRVRESGVAKTAMGDFEIVSTFSDWREVDGVMYPFKTNMTQAGMPMELTFETVVHGAEIPDSTFDFPPVIQKLVDKKKEKEAKEKGSGDEAGATSGPKESGPEKKGPASSPGG